MENIPKLKRCTVALERIDITPYLIEIEQPAVQNVQDAVQDGSVPQQETEMDFAQQNSLMQSAHLSQSESIGQFRKQI